MRRYLSLLLILGLLFLIGCSKSDNNPTQPQETPPSPPVVPQIQAPANAPAIVQQTLAGMQSFMNMGFTYLSALSGLQPNQQGDTWTWTVVQGQLTATITATKQSDGSVTWTVVLNGTDGNTVYQNWKSFEGTVAADENSGTWTFYELNSQTVSATAQWNRDASGNYHAVLTITATGEKTDLQIQADGSGDVTVYRGQKKMLEIHWNADGSGWWKSYDDQGNILQQGTWS